MKKTIASVILCFPALLILFVGLGLPMFSLALDAARAPLSAADLSADVIVRVQITTLRIAFLSTFLSVGLAFFAAVLLRGSSRKLRNLVLALSLFPTGVHIVFRAFGVQVLLGQEGPLSHLLGLLSIALPDVLFTEVATVIGLAHWLFPISLIPLMIAVWSLSSETRSAAELMGIPSHVIFVRIEMPQLRSAIIATTGLVFCLAYGAFVTPSVLGGLQDITLSRLIGGLLAEGHSSQATLPALIGASTPLLLFAMISLLRGPAGRR
jgi:ABC-type spermidine/putrescine transport system permease subunit I